MTMSQSDQLSTSRTDKLVPSHVLVRAEELVSEFEQLLASEMNLLKSGRTEGMQAIAEAKQLLIDELGSIEPTLVASFVNHPEASDVQSLKDRLTQCRTDSRNNYALVMLELKHTNKSLELLRSVLRMDDLSLYSQRGDVDVKREKRRLGSA